MALETQRAGVYGRRPSIRGRVVTRVVNGQEVTQRWPKKRGKNLKQNTLDQMEFFRQVQWAYKFSPPLLQVEIREAVAGTPLLPRDLFLKAISGRLMFMIDPNGKKWFSMAGIKDVSANLDIIAQTPGDLIVRGESLWGALPAGATGFVLTSQGEELPPVWAPPTGGGGGEWTLAANITISTPTLEIVIPVEGYSEAMVLGAITTGTTSCFRGVEVSIDGGLTYLTTSGDYLTINAAGTQTAAAFLGFQGTAAAASRWFGGHLFAMSDTGTPRPFYRFPLGDTQIVFNGQAAAITHIRIVSRVALGGAEIAMTAGTLAAWLR